MEQENYKVLWVEDDGNIVESTQQIADMYNLELDRVLNWDEAKEKLDADFEDYSAIILDAFCIVNRNDLADKDFIHVALNGLTAIFTTKGTQIPWYIYSAGTMKNFDSVIDVAGKIRAPYKDEWGEMWFLKDAPADTPRNVEVLFSKIPEIAERQFQNSVLYRHRDVFSYIGKGRVIDFPEARRYMIKMLDALYFPEENLKFQYEGNPIRKVLEYMFWAAKKKGLLPEECFNERGVALQNARKFMEGKTIPIAEDGEIVYKVRWGKSREKIFDDDVAKSVQIILDFANSDSHVDDEYVDEETPYFVNENKKEKFFSYVMQLCYVIRWFGKYVGKHPDAVKNREKHSFVSAS